MTFILPSIGSGIIASPTTPAFSNTYSVDLDGSNDYIDCGGASDFGFTDGSGNDDPFSISAWVKLDSTSIQRMVDKSGTTQASRSYLFGTDGDSKFSLFLGPGTGNYLYVRDGSNLITGVWYHLVATYDGSNASSGITLYKNGSAISAQDLSSGSYAGMPSTSETLKIGRLNLNGSVMNGLVDEVAVFDYELSSSQVSDIYNSGVPNDISSLNPVGWWRMGDNDGGTGTTITDQGSGGNDGTLINGPTFSTNVPTPVFNSYSVDLDGSNDYIDCGGDADFSFTDGSGNDDPFSISAWVKLDANTRARVVAKGNMEWLFGTNSSNRFALYLWSNDGTSAYLSVEENAGLTLGTWHHLVATYDGSNTSSGIKLYKAGSLVTMNNLSVGSYAGLASQQGALRIGQWEVNSSVMNGLVDEVSVFDYELTSSQVSSIYNSGSPTDISSLSPLGWWRMGDNDGGTGTTITDQGSGGNNGTLTNGPTFSTTVP